MRLEGGGDDDVLARRQPQPRAHLPQVDEELGASAGGVGEEKVPLQMDPRPARKLRGELLCFQFSFDDMLLILLLE